MPPKKLVAALRKNKSFLITTHKNMEGDALGSQIALYYLLRALKKNIFMLNEDRALKEFSFLPAIEKIKTLGQEPRGFSFDCFVVVDCSDLGRCGRVAKLGASAATTINIDHHISNNFFGGINWVRPQLSSASEMVYLLYKKLGVTITKDIALLLYTGIATDTGFFHYTNTSSATHRAAAELLRCGVSSAEVYRVVNENINFSQIKLLTKGLENIRCQAKGKLAWLSLPQVMPKKVKNNFDLGEHFLGFMRAIKGVEVAVLFKEILGAKKQVRVNFRSQGKVDVNKIATHFAGGGHKSASGATVEGSLNSVIIKVLKEVKRHFPVPCTAGLHRGEE